MNPLRARMLRRNTLQKPKLKSNFGLSTYTFKFRKLYSHGTKGSMQETVKILKEKKKDFLLELTFCTNTNYYFQQAIPTP